RRARQRVHETTHRLDRSTDSTATRRSDTVGRHQCSNEHAPRGSSSETRSWVTSKTRYRAGYPDSTRDIGIASAASASQATGRAVWYFAPDHQTTESECP